MTNPASPAPTADAGAEPRLLRIQEVAADTGLTPRTIRYYEELGLLAPAGRSEGAYRLYDAEDLERLRFIRGLRDDAGFSLAEIGQLLEDEAARARNRASFRSSTDTAERRAILEDAIARIDRQVGSLRAQDRAARGDDPGGRGAEGPSGRPHRRPRRRPRADPRPPVDEPPCGPPRHGAPMIRPGAGLSFANGARAFRHRNYRLFFGGQLISLIGTWMQAVAQGWLILQLTGDPFDCSASWPRCSSDPGHDPRPVRRAHRRCPAQAADADRDPGDQDDAVLHHVRPGLQRQPYRCGRSWPSPSWAA